MELFVALYRKPLIKPTPIPVSYTHLDVYKRQLSDVTPEFYNQVLEACRNMATALDATLTVVDDGTITDGVETGTVYVQSNSDPSAIVYIFGTSIAPGAPAASGNDVSDSIPTIVGLSCTAVVAVVAAAVWMTKRKAAGQNI